MSTLKTAKTLPLTTLMAILMMLAAGLAQAGEKGAYLGVMLQDINTSMAKAMDMDDENGVLVNEVVDGSPAHEAGLQDGDVIISFNGKDLANHKALTKAVSKSAPGEKVEVIVLRDGNKKKLKVKLGERQETHMSFFSDEDRVHSSHGGENVFVWRGNEHGDNKQFEIMIKDLDGMHEERGFMGIEVDDISEQMGDFLDVEDGEGALITSVTENSAAEQAGLKAGDVIINIGDDEVDEAAEVYEALAGTQPGQKLDIELIRKGKKKSLEITLGEVPESQMVKHMGMIGGDNDFFIQSPKMHNERLNEMRIIYDDDEDLKEMRQELENMKKELKKMKEELKK